MHPTQIEKNDKFRVAQEEYQIEIQTANIVGTLAGALTLVQSLHSFGYRISSKVRSAEGLLYLITELKQSFLLNDTKTLAHFAKKRAVALQTQKQEIKRTIMQLKKEVDSAVLELEDCYYRFGT